MSDKKETKLPEPKSDPANKLLSAEVAAQYEIVNWTGGHRQNFGKFGIVDLKVLTPKDAELLVKMKFTKIIRK